jgi:hypothetical protein
MPGAGGTVVVKATTNRKVAGWVDTRWGDLLNLPNPSSRTRPWVSLSL